MLTGSVLVMRCVDSICAGSVGLVKRDMLTGNACVAAREREQQAANRQDQPGFGSTLSAGRTRPLCSHLLQRGSQVLQFLLCYCIKCSAVN